MTRVTDLASQNMSLNIMRNTQNRILDAQLQISTGKKSIGYEGVAGDAAQIVSLEASHMRAEQFMANNNLVDLRLQKIESNVSGLMDLATRARTFIVNALNGDNYEDLALATNGQFMLDEAAGLLNASENGRYLFAGSMTNTEPVDLTALPADGNFPLTADNYYYQGDTQVLSIRADETLTVSYGVRADESGFEKLIRSLKIMETTDLTDETTAKARLENALSILNEALDEIPDIRSRVGNARGAIENANGKLDEFTLYAEQAIGDLENVDLSEAITRLSGDQAAMEASYAALARIQSVSLVDFLR